MPLPETQTVTAFGCAIQIDGNYQRTPQFPTSQPILFQASTTTSPAAHPNVTRPLHIRSGLVLSNQWPSLASRKTEPNPTGVARELRSLAGRPHLLLGASSCEGRTDLAREVFPLRMTTESNPETNRHPTASSLFATSHPDSQTLQLQKAETAPCVSP
jgi:hypothetical protein